MRHDVIAGQMEGALRKSLQAPRLRLIGLDGERPEAETASAPWIEVKYGPASPDDWFGVVPATARFERDPGQGAETLKLIVKVNPRLGLARKLIPWIVETKKIALDRPYWDYRSTKETDDTVDREFHVYEAAAAGNAALARVLPRYYGAAFDRTTGESALFIELLDGIARLDSVAARGDWPLEAIGATFDAAAEWQATFWNAGDAPPSSLSWAGPRVTTADMLADEPLWRGMLEDARVRFPDIVTDGIARRRHALIDTLGVWYPVKDRLPGTLAHNDFSQRNVGFHPRVVALDWELAQCNTAQRDLVEMLMFVLPSFAGRADVDRLLECHRVKLAALGAEVDRDLWAEAFRSELKTQAIDRIGMQCIFEAAFPLAYFARINANIERLLGFYE